MSNVLTLLVALAALLISASNFWLTQLRKGRILLSRPTIFFFGGDKHDDVDVAKVMFRAALFSTAQQGQVLEYIYIIVDQEGRRTSFPFWGYDDGTGMVRGSGVYVGKEGHVANHHFNPIGDDASFSFAAGKCSVEVWVRRHGAGGDERLGQFRFDLVVPPSGALTGHDAGLLWTWVPSMNQYLPEYSKRASLRS